MRPRAARICEGGDGLLFPAFGEWEAAWPQGVKIVLYMLGLGYCFLGVAIVADIFMGAIEKITSCSLRLLDRRTGRHRVVKVWNDTISNLSLMALGSSAPEILLSIIELLRNDMYAGDLGPGTIVGSAAFNLMCISAVCIASIPSRPTIEVRYIKDVSVYAVTATTSILAYVWLVAMLLWISPDFVSVWEGVVTLLMFPVLLFVAFAADKGWLCGCPKRRQSFTASELSRDELAKLVMDIRAEFGDLDDATVASIIEQKESVRRSRAYHRVTTSLFRRYISNSVRRNLQKALPGGRADQEEPEPSPSSRGSGPAPRDRGRGVVDFAEPHYAVSEDAGHVVVQVLRFDGALSTLRVGYRTRDGTAKAQHDYRPAAGVLELAPGVARGEIRVAIIDDTDWENAENFFIELLELSESQRDAIGKQPVGLTVPLGAAPIATAMVTIIDNDDPGKLVFTKDLVVCEERPPSERALAVEVLRRHGSSGEVSCRYRTQGGTASAPLDFEAVEGVLTLKEGEVKGYIEVVIKARGRYDKVGRFSLVLFEPTRCRLGDDTCLIEIWASPESKSSTDVVANSLHESGEAQLLASMPYTEQFVAALFVGGSSDAQSEAGCFDWILHLVSFPWKIIFAAIPPPDFLGGWLCFVFALSAIGFVTAMVTDLASLLGCSLGLHDAVTAITFVALGTSLPDTIASKSAAVSDPYADASIGNITGSNAVNVFLGIGLTWTIGAIYWTIQGPTSEWKNAYPRQAVEYPDGGLVVEAKGVLFSVSVFAGCGLATISFLYARRRLYGGELGGPFAPKVASAVLLLFMWCCYIGVSVAYIEASDEL